jgi:Protein of unknown function (DUF559)
VPVQPIRPDVLRGRVFRGTWAVGRGLLSADQLRSAAWQRLRRDVYADSAIEVTHRVLAHGVALVAPKSAVFGGLTAVVLAGGDEFAGTDDPVELLLPPGERWRPGPGVTVRTAAADPDVVMGRDGLPRTGPVRTAVDLIRREHLDDGVVLLDRLVAGGLVALDPVRQAAATLPRCRGSKIARDVASLADGEAQSPPETRLRLLIRRAGLPAPQAQYRVFGEDGFIARVDFAYPDRRLAIEYDGLWHGEKNQVSKDRRRQNRLSAAGWRILFVTAVDMYDPEGLIARIAAALAW